MSALNGLGSSPTLVYYMTMTSSVAQNTRASSPWRTERYNKILRSCLTWSQAFLLWNKCMLVQIVVSLVNGRPGAQRFTYSPVLQDFTKATNIRLTFLRTNTLLGHLISKAQRDPTVTRRVSRAHDLTQTCRPAIRLSSFLESRLNFQFFFSCSITTVSKTSASVDVVSATAMLRCAVGAATRTEQTGS